MSEFEKVQAVHSVTGIISWVLPNEIETIEALSLATEKQIKAAITREEIAVYGRPVTGAAETTSKDGAANG